MIKKTLTRSKIVKKLDSIFSVYIRIRDSNEKGIVTCPLCGTKVPRKKAQNMHFITRGNYKYRWDEKNCYAGCMRCNVLLNGNYIVYTRFMQKKFGLDFVDRMINDKSLANFKTYQLEELIDYYNREVSILSQKFK